MPPAQQPSTDAAHKAAMLRGLLQQPSNKHNVAPLVAAITARVVDIHEKMLTDLGSKVQQLERSRANESEHTARVLEQTHNIEQDVKSLRELIQADRQRNTDTGPDPDQLKVDLIEAINQHSAEMTGFGRRLQITQEAVEGQQHTTNRVKEILDSFGQRNESLQCDIGRLKGSLEKVPFAAPIVERIAKIEEKMVKCFDQSSRDAEIIKLSLAAIKQNLGPREALEHAMDQPTNDTNTLDGRLTGQSKSYFSILPWVYLC